MSFFPFWNRLLLGKTGLFPWQRFYLTDKERVAHIYVVGTTTRGKSKLLEHCFLQDVRAGRGATLIDPHSDLAEDVMRHLAHRAWPWNVIRSSQAPDRLIYLDPSRKDYVIGINPLEVQPGTDLYEQAGALIEVFKRIWAVSLEEAPVFEDVMLNSLMALMEGHLTLLELPRLLTDKPFREGVLYRATSPTVKEFFYSRYERWGREQALRIESSLNKVSALISSQKLRYILGQERSTINFRRILEEGLALVVNLGTCGEMVARLLGSFLVVRLHQAAVSRQDTPRANRRPHYLYLDEFQDFVSGEGGIRTFSRVLTDSAKFGLYLILCHQTQSQMDSRVRGAIGNVATRVVFACDREDAEVMARKLFAVDLAEVKDEARTETQHPLFYPLQEHWERYVQTIRELPPRYAYVKAHQRPVVRIRTMAMPDRSCPEEKVEALKVACLKRYARPSHEVVTEIDRRYGRETPFTLRRVRFEKI